jgi:Leucine-rich repeat (LRR) protein
MGPVVHAALMSCAAWTCFLSERSAPLASPPQVLHLGGNRIDGPLPTSLGSLTSIRVLNASSNQLVGTLPPSIGNLSSLRDLVLHTNSISGALPTEIGQATALRRVQLQTNRLSGNLSHVRAHASHTLRPNLA